MVPDALSGSRVAPARAALGSLHRGMAGDLRRRESGGRRLRELWQQATRVRMNRCPCGRTEKLWARAGPVTAFSSRTIRCSHCLERLLASELMSDVGNWYKLAA